MWPTVPEMNEFKDYIEHQVQQAKSPVGDRRVRPSHRCLQINGFKSGDRVAAFSRDGVVTT